MGLRTRMGRHSPAPKAWLCKPSLFFSPAASSRPRARITAPTSANSTSLAWRWCRTPSRCSWKVSWRRCGADALEVRSIVPWQSDSPGDRDLGAAGCPPGAGSSGRDGACCWSSAQPRTGQFGVVDRAVCPSSLQLSFPCLCPCRAPALHSSAREAERHEEQSLQPHVPGRGPTGARGDLLVSQQRPTQREAPHLPVRPDRAR